MNLQAAAAFVQLVFLLLHGSVSGVDPPLHQAVSDELLSQEGCQVSGRCSKSNKEGMATAHIPLPHASMPLLNTCKAAPLS